VIGAVRSLRAAEFKVGVVTQRASLSVGKVRGCRHRRRVLCSVRLVGHRRTQARSGHLRGGGQICELPLAGWMIAIRPKLMLQVALGPGSRSTDRPGGPMTLMPHPQSWNNPWHGRADGASVRRILETAVWPSEWIHRAGRRDCGSHRDVVGIHAVGLGRRRDQLAYCSLRRVGRVPLGPASASHAAAWFWSMRFMLIHDTVRAGRRPSGPDGSSLAAASDVRKSPVLSARPGWADTGRVRRVPHIGLKAPSVLSRRSAGYTRRGS